jgi:WhiB family redox-sensing transcriptional regulator
MIPVPTAAADAWQHLADTLAQAGPVACRTSRHPEAWWPDGDDHTDGPAQAVAHCRACPARTPCLDYAVAAGESHGIWGGTTPTERRPLLTTATDQEAA